MRRLIVSLVIASLFVPSGMAQNAQQPPLNPRTPPAPPSTGQQARRAGKPTIRTAVDLVLIDVRVTDRSGKPVTGLKPEQFTVLEDDKPQKITSFDYYDIEAIEGAASTNIKPVVVALGTVAPLEKVRPIVRDHRLIALFFDLTSMQPAELVRARESAERYVREQMTPADLVAVVTFANQLKVPAHFTNDRDLLLRAIRSLRPGKDAQLAYMAEAAAQPGEAVVSEYTGSAFTPDETEFNIFNTDRKLAAVESLADLMRGIPGRKSVIHFTGGIQQTGEENRAQLRAATDAANRANVSFYTVDARGLFADIPGGDASKDAAAGATLFTGESASRQFRGGRAMFTGAVVSSETQSRKASRETLATLAMDTGGKAFFDLGDFREVFQKVQAEAGGYYLVGYYSANPQLNGRWRRVRVRVNASGSRVRYREGYYAPRDHGVATAEDRERQLIDALHGEEPRVEFPVALETAYFRLNDREVFVSIAAKLASSALEWAKKRGRHQAEFDFAAEVRDQKSNKVVGALRDTIKVSLGAERFQQVQQHPLVYQGGMVMEPGNYRLKFLARENETGRIGSFEELLSLPSAQRERLELSSMLLSSQLESVSQTSEVTRKTLGTEAKLKTTPLEVSGKRIVPSVTRVFTAQQELYVFFQAYPPPNSGGSKLRAGLVLFRNGQWWSETSLVEPAEVETKSQTASFRIGLPLEKLPPGGYTIQAVVVEDGSTQAAFARNYFALRANSER